MEEFVSVTAAGPPSGVMILGQVFVKFSSYRPSSNILSLSLLACVKKFSWVNFCDVASSFLTGLFTMVLIIRTAAAAEIDPVYGEYMLIGSVICGSIIGLPILLLDNLKIGALDASEIRMKQGTRRFNWVCNLRTLNYNRCAAVTRTRTHTPHSLLSHTTRHVGWPMLMYRPCYAAAIAVPNPTPSNPHHFHLFISFFPLHFVSIIVFYGLQGRL
jgi:hypothetical protein